MNFYSYISGIAGDVGELDHEILEYLVSAGTARGWFPAVSGVVTHFTEHEKEADVLASLDGLRKKQLLFTEEDRVLSIMGGITHEVTDFRAFTGAAVPFYLQGALDALCIAPTLQKKVEVITKCGVTGDQIQLHFGPACEITDSNPRDVCAFIPEWDEVESLQTWHRGHFFRDEGALEKWQADNGEPDGMPLTADTIRMVGLEMARAISDLYVRISIR